MALATKCQTPGVTFHTGILGFDDRTEVTINFTMKTGRIGFDEIQLLEKNIHNALELVLAKYYVE